MKFELHPFYPDAGLPPLLAICREDGYNDVIGEEDVPTLIAVLERYQRGEHDGVIERGDPRTRHHVDDGEMTVEAVARKYGLESGTVRRSIHGGYIAAHKSGKNWLISKSDAEARWGNGRRKPGPKAK